MPDEQKPLDQEAFQSLFKYEPESLRGKGAIVTGGTTGIGRAIVMLLLARGANVLTFGRHEKELDDAMADFKRIGGGTIYGMTADVTQPRDVAVVFKEADQRLGKLDILINCAGVAAESVVDTEPAAWRQALDTNLFGYMLCCKEAASRMKPRKAGFIINIGSMSAKACGAGSDVYVATKTGIRGFTDSLTKSLNKENIRVALVEPGLVGSELTKGSVPEDEQEETYAQMEILRAEELAHCVVYCLEQPRACNVVMVQIRPTRQSV